MTELFVATGDALAHVVGRGGEWTVGLTLEGRGVQCLALDPRDPGTV